MVACFVNPESFRGQLRKTSRAVGFPFPRDKNQYRLAVISTEVRTGGHAYSVLIGTGLVRSIGDLVKKELPPTRCATISDTNVAPRFLAPIQKGLRAAGFDPVPIMVAAGEHAKTLEKAGEICEEMLRAGLDRQSFVIGLGGGVIGDLSGFVAAIFQRGIPHVQVPTTLLAMVDSSIGGKTGVNARAGKNLIGAVHQPAMVIDDTEILKTLPRHELSQGFAEIIKHAIIADEEMFRQLQDLDRAEIDFEPLIRRNVEIKARIIADDERDQKGERALLNFGHTVGHGIERPVDYQGISHGDAISLGMIAACEISLRRAGLSKSDRDAIVDLLGKFNLPSKLPAKFPREKIFDALKFDKKFEHGEIRFVVASKIGSAKLSRDVRMEDIRAAVDTL
jgi:3-dehydroquinate synthase